MWNSELNQVPHSAFFRRAFGELDITDTFTTTQSFLDGLTAPLAPRCPISNKYYHQYYHFPKNTLRFGIHGRNGLNTGFLHDSQPEII